MNTTFSTTLKNHLSEVTKLHETLEEFGRTQQIPESVLSSMDLALEEILTNIISYGYQDTQEHDILLRLILEGEELIAEVVDDGKPFNPLNVPDPDVTLPIEDRPIGGLGIHLTKKMMDGIDYAQLDGKNLLRLRKKLSTSTRISHHPAEGHTMEILQEQQGHVIILSLVGRLDANTSTSLEEKLLALIETDNRLFIIDCTQLDYISSAGLRVLLMAAKKLKPLDGKVALASLKDHIKEIFEIAGFLSIFKIFSGQEEAIKDIQ